MNKFDNSEIGGGEALDLSQQLNRSNRNMEAAYSSFFTDLGIRLASSAVSWKTNKDRTETLHKLRFEVMPAHSAAITSFQKTGDEDALNVATKNAFRIIPNGDIRKTYEANALAENKKRATYKYRSDKLINYQTNTIGDLQEISANPEHLKLALENLDRYSGDIRESFGYSPDAELQTVTELQSQRIRLLNHAVNTSINSGDLNQARFWLEKKDIKDKEGKLYLYAPTVPDDLRLKMMHNIDNAEKHKIQLDLQLGKEQLPIKRLVGYKQQDITRSSRDPELQADVTAAADLIYSNPEAAEKLGLIGNVHDLALEHRFVPNSLNIHLDALLSPDVDINQSKLAAKAIRSLFKVRAENLDKNLITKAAEVESMTDAGHNDTAIRIKLGEMRKAIPLDSTSKSILMKKLIEDGITFEDPDEFNKKVLGYTFFSNFLDTDKSNANVPGKGGNALMMQEHRAFVLNGVALGGNPITVRKDTDTFIKRTWGSSKFSPSRKNENIWVRYPIEQEEMYEGIVSNKKKHEAINDDIAESIAKEYPGYELESGDSFVLHRYNDQSPYYEVMIRNKAGGINSLVKDNGELVVFNPYNKTRIKEDFVKDEFASLSEKDPLRGTTVVPGKDEKINTPEGI